jgi:hypothetical protein
LTQCMLALKYDHASIARSTGIPEGACNIYEPVFFNMRHRNWIELTSLVFPEGRQIEFLPGYDVKESLTNLALRAAVQYGLPAVEELLGRRNAPGDSDVIGQARALIAQTLSTANLMYQWGFAHQNLAIFSRALRVLPLARSDFARQQLNSSMTAVERRDLAKALSESVMRLVGTDRQIGVPADSPEAPDLRQAEPRGADINAGDYQEPVESDLAKREPRLLRAA